VVAQGCRHGRGGDVEQHGLAQAAPGREPGDFQDVSHRPDTTPSLSLEKGNPGAFKSGGRLPKEPNISKFTSSKHGLGLPKFQNFTFPACPRGSFRTFLSNTSKSLIFPDI
jgi:hypothetical protein